MDSLASTIVWKNIPELQKRYEKREKDVTKFGSGDIQ